MIRLTRSRLALVSALVASIAAAGAAARCYYGSGKGCCIISLMGPGTSTTTCTTEQDCGWSIVSDQYTLIVRVGAPGQDNFASNGTTTKCTSSPGKCVNGLCVYGQPFTVSCTDVVPSGNPC